MGYLYTLGQYIVSMDFILSGQNQKTVGAIIKNLRMIEKVNFQRCSLAVEKFVTVNSST